MKWRKSPSHSQQATVHIKKPSITEASSHWEPEQSQEASWKLEASHLGQGRSTGGIICSATAHGAYVLCGAEQPVLSIWHLS